jgi:hypothetical protein
MARRARAIRAAEERTRLMGLMRLMCPIQQCVRAFSPLPNTRPNSLILTADTPPSS